MERYHVDLEMIRENLSELPQTAKKMGYAIVYMLNRGPLLRRISMPTKKGTSIFNRRMYRKVMLMPQGKIKADFQSSSVKAPQYTKRQFVYQKVKGNL